MEETREYLRQYMVAKRLLEELNEQYEQAKTSTEKGLVVKERRKVEKITNEIHNLVFTLPVSLELTLIEMRYLKGMSTRNICRKLDISRAKYSAHMQKAVAQLKETRESK